jgi:4-amino-4-deoxy-L-arabinose transferase-like glycosyltransferase
MRSRPHLTLPTLVTPPTARPSPALPSPTLAHKPIVRHERAIIASATVFLVALLIQGYRLSSAPDVFDDEGYYLQPALNLAKGHGLVGAGHTVFVVQPPGYMAIEAVYIKLTGLTSADPLAALFSVRNLNIFFSAITAVLLMLFGRKLYNYAAGLAAAALFIMDPYVVRINRRSMLETLAMLCVLFGIYIFFTRQPHLTALQRLSAGVAFGLALLTKEPMALELLILAAYVAMFRRSQIRDMAWVAATAFLVYLPYPLWALAIGQWNTFLSVKRDQLVRIPRALADMLPGASSQASSPSAYAHSPQNLLDLLPQYGTSYVVIALAAISSFILILRFGHLIAVRYLTTWTLLSFVVGWAVVLVSDQYVYYLIVPCIVVCGFVLALLLDSTVYPVSLRTSPFRERRGTVSARASAVARHLWKPILALFLVILFYADYVSWMAHYTVGSDNAYIKAIEYVRSHVPKGATIVTDGAGMTVFLSSYEVTLDRDPNVIVAKHEHYFILSSKNVGYGTTTPQYYSWVVRHSRPLFVQEDRSFWKVGVYLRTETG